MNELLILALWVLVVARLTRLVNYDTVLDPLRLAVARRISTAQREGTTTRWSKLAEFMACPWCVSMWIAAATAPAAITVLDWPLWTWTALPFAASHLVGIGDRWVADPLEIVEDR